SHRPRGGGHPDGSEETAAVHRNPRPRSGARPPAFLGAAEGVFILGLLRSSGRAHGSLMSRSGSAAFSRRISSSLLGGGGEPRSPPSSINAMLKSCQSILATRSHHGAVTITISQRRSSESMRSLRRAPLARRHRSLLLAA